MVVFQPIHKFRFILTFSQVYLKLPAFGYILVSILQNSPFFTTFLNNLPLSRIPSSLHWTFRLFLMFFVLHHRIVHRDASLSLTMVKKIPYGPLAYQCRRINSKPFNQAKLEGILIEAGSTALESSVSFLLWGSLFLVDENFKIAVSLLGHRSYLFLGTIVSELGSQYKS